MKLLRVCSMWQPWATLCVAPLPSTGKPPKRHETRAFAPRVTLPCDVVIHATKRWGRGQVETSFDPFFRRALNHCGFLAGPATKQGVFGDPRLKPLPFGAIIGIATIVEVAPTHSFFGYDREPDSYDSVFGDWSPGRYAWRFDSTRLLPEPIPFKGRQDVLYLLDPAVQAQLDEQLATAAV